MSYTHLPRWLSREMKKNEWMAVGRWIEVANDDGPDIANFDIASMGQEGRSDQEMCEMAELCAAAPTMYAALMAMTTSFSMVAWKEEHMQEAMDMAHHAMARAVRKKEKKP